MNFIELILGEILKDHCVEDTPFYRFHYMNYEKMGSLYNHSMCGCQILTTNYFSFPGGMDKYDAFLILSYLVEKAEKENNLGACHSSALAITTITLPKYGFNVMPYSRNAKNNNITSLFTITGRIRYFKKTEEYKKYFEWFTPGVTQSQVMAIYEKYDIPFPETKETTLKRD